MANLRNGLRTIQVDDEIVNQLKVYAAKNRTKMKDAIKAALIEFLKDTEV